MTSPLAEQRFEEASRARMRSVIFVEHVDASVFWMDAIDALRAAKVDVVFVTLRDPEPIHQACAKRGVPAYALRARTSRDYPLAARRLSRILKNHHINVLHTSEAIAASVAGLIPRSAWRGLRIFDWGSGYLRKGRERTLARFGALRTDAIVANSTATAQLAETHLGVSSRRIRVIRRGVREPRQVPPAELSRLRARLGIPDGTPILSVVTRLRPEKSLHLMIEALPTVERSLGSPVALVIAGDGSEAETLRAMASNSTANQIFFVGSQADVAPWIRIADATALPSLYEGLPKSVIEAMASRTPVVASNVGGIPELIDHNRTGLLVSPGCVGSLSKALIHLLASPSHASCMASAAYDVYTARLTIAAMTDAWVKCYKDLSSPRVLRR